RRNTIAHHASDSTGQSSHSCLPPIYFIQRLALNNYLVRSTTYHAGNHPRRNYNQWSGRSRCGNQYIKRCSCYGPRSGTPPHVLSSRSSDYSACNRPYNGPKELTILVNQNQWTVRRIAVVAEHRVLTGEL